MNYFEAIILAIIEGLTEYLPVSSTGHLIVGTALLGLEPTDFVKLYTIAVQPGAILSVLVLYWKRFLKSFLFYLYLLIAFIPAAVFGFMFDDLLDSLLESPLTVGITLFIGGVLLLFVDRWFKENENNPNQEMNYKKSLTVGLFQVLAMIPGTSRSAATIVGGLAAKLNRKNAAEFSFFLAVPTLLAATGYKLLKYLKSDGLVLSNHDINVLLIGNIVSFVVGLIAIKGFISFLTRKGFVWFGWYRIVVGGIIICLLLFKYELAIV
ncbi:MAG: undecaprenyl-diphosphate phosphatase [Bacteroidetes bacterium]|nr:undecaprenyl-diphosphate phosphatase [Bacteroidota bacterium]